jgi:hypothetical protein
MYMYVVIFALENFIDRHVILLLFYYYYKDCQILYQGMGCRVVKVVEL